MAVIDAHVHMGPGLANSTSKPILTAETTEQLIAILDLASIDQACVFPPLMEGGDFEDPGYSLSNRSIYEAQKLNPERIIGFCRVNPNLGQQALDEMQRCKDDYGFRGLKLHPDWDYFYLHGPTVRPVLDRAVEFGWPVLFHTGYYPLSHPTLVLPVADAYPTIDFILAHLGYQHTADAIVVAQRCSNVYLETSGNSTAHAIARVIAEAGAHKLIFGSDLPYTLPEDVQLKISLQPDLTEEDEGLIFGGTIKRLLGSN